MTPKEQADKLLDNMLNVVYETDCFGSEYDVAVKCAIASVNQIIDSENNLISTFEQLAYWKEVKIELEKL